MSRFLEHCPMCGIVDCERARANHIIRDFQDWAENTGAGRIYSFEDALNLYMKTISVKCDNCPTKGDCDFEKPKDSTSVRVTQLGNGVMRIERIGKK